jgi:hypothetical protein
VDELERFHKFASEIAKALNDAGTVPIDDKTHMSAVLVMVAQRPEGKRHGPQPVGGSLNYVDGKWIVDVQLAEVTPVVCKREQA